jgi:hypothetical protein
MIHVSPTYTVLKDPTRPKGDQWVLTVRSTGVLPTIIGSYPSRKKATVTGALLAGWKHKLVVIK